MWCGQLASRPSSRFARSAIASSSRPTLSSAVDDAQIDVDLIRVPRQHRIHRAAVQAAERMRLRRASAPVAIGLRVQLEQREVRARILVVQLDRALEQAHALVDAAVVVEPIARASRARRAWPGRHSAAMPARRRPPRARSARCSPARSLVVVVACAAPRTGAPSPARWRSRGGAARSRCAARRLLEAREQRLRMLRIDREDQIAEVLAQRELEQAQRRHLERRGSRPTQRARDWPPALRDGLRAWRRERFRRASSRSCLDRRVDRVARVGLVVADRASVVGVVGSTTRRGSDVGSSRPATTTRAPARRASARSRAATASSSSAVTGSNRRGSGPSPRAVSHAPSTCWICSPSVAAERIERLAACRRAPTRVQPHRAGLRPARARATPARRAASGRRTHRSGVAPRPACCGAK